MYLSAEDLISCCRTCGNGLVRTYLLLFYFYFFTGLDLFPALHYFNKNFYSLVRTYIYLNNTLIISVHLVFNVLVAKVATLGKLGKHSNSWLGK